MTSSAIVWRGIYLPGHEYARVERRDSAWLLDGVAAFRYDASPCRLDYQVRCSQAWVTQSARVWGWVGERQIDVDVVASEDRRWWLNDVECVQVEGCTDLDLNFSPVTNTLPIRRLSLEVGGQAIVRAAWLRFPSLQLAALEQSYCRVAEDRYRYESAGGRFTAELTVDGFGLVRNYPGVWVAE